MAFGGARQAFIGRKQRDFVTHAGRADMRHANAGHHGLGKGQRRKVIALGFHHQANHRAGMNVERAAFNQQAVDGGVKPAVINDIVDMP